MNDTDTTASGADERAGCIAGLRQLADILESTPGVPLPYSGTTDPLFFFADTAADFHAFTGAVPGPFDREIIDRGPHHLRLTGHIGGMPFKLFVRSGDGS